jgi:glyoxylase-like metal-dependent hydrolase (beta-lactamase superfamily II)
VHVLRYPVLDVNATLIVGGEVAALVDTLATDTQARELLDLIRAITTQPLVIINTHHHFDHCFGNDVIAAASPGCTIWAHEETARLLREEGSTWQRDWSEEWSDQQPDLAKALAEVQVRAPDRGVRLESIMDLGGRTIELRHLGRGHTDGDLIVDVPDANVIIAGDLVEQGAPPSFEDSFPIEWPDTLAALLHRAKPQAVVVPGHGEVVELEFVRQQHGELASLAWLIREAHGDGAPPDEVATKSPFSPDVVLPAVTRGYAELAGKL